MKPAADGSKGFACFITTKTLIRMNSMECTPKNDKVKTLAKTSGEEKPSDDNENSPAPTDDKELDLLHLSRILPPNYAENAHIFQKETFTSSQDCFVCKSSITGGFWSNKQGLECKDCGIVLGFNHNQCHAEAMMKQCSKTLVEPEATESKDSESEGVEEDKKARGSNAENSKRELMEEQKKTPLLTRIASRRRSSVYDRPHKFMMHSYGSPTYCAVCQGLLVGLWSQGLQCQDCHLNVHRGEGVGEHDDCRMEALMWPCNGEPLEEDHVMTLREAMALSPHFIKDVTDQMGKDLHSHAKEIVVSAGVDEERTKKLRRLRTQIIAAVERLDAMDELGELYCICVLLRLHMILAVTMLLVGILVFRVALSPKMGLDVSNANAFRLTLASELTASFTARLHLMVLAIGLRYGALLFHRKAIMVDRFLHDVFGIDAEKDFGISVVSASRRTRTWSDRFVVATGLACCIVIICWILCQPSLEERDLTAMFPESSSSTEASVTSDL